MSNILRKLLRQQKKDTRINWVHNEELRAYLRVSLDVVFALDEKVGRIALEAFLSYVNGIGADDIEKAKALCRSNSAAAISTPSTSLPSAFIFSSSL